MVLLWLALFISCTTRPVPHLERAMSALEADHERARAIANQDEKIRAYRTLRDEVADFRLSLDGERELDPNARVRASSRYEGGMAWVHVDRRDVASIRQRADRLLRSLDRYLSATPPPTPQDSPS
jgi:hypothetical protein